MVKLKKQKVHIRKKRLIFPQMPMAYLKTISRFLLLVMLLAIIGGGLVKIKYTFVDSDYFMVKALDVKLYDASGSLKSFSLNEIGGEKIAGTNVFFMDLNKLKERMELAHPEYKDIVVRRLLPNKVIMEANLRKAIAQIRSDRYYPVDAEGVFLPDVKNFPDPTLPIIIGIRANLAKIQPFSFSDFEKDKIDKALGLIGEMHDIDELKAYRLKVLDTTDPGNLTFSFEGTNVEIKIGNSDFRNRLRILARVLDQVSSDMGKFKYIDLRFEDPIIGPR